MENTTSPKRLNLSIKAIFVVSAMLLLALLMSAPTSIAQEPERQTTTVDVSSGLSVTGRSEESASQKINPQQAGAACTAQPPVLLTPSAAEVTNDLKNPRFSWNQVDDIREYIFQVASNEDFSQLLATERKLHFTGTTIVWHTSFKSLDKNTTYYWRVASVCADGTIGSFSTPFMIQTGDGPGDAECTLDPPTLLSPADESEIDTLLPALKWGTTEGVFETSYELALNPSFQPVVEVINFIGIDPDLQDFVQRIPSDNLMQDTVYYWRVASTCAEIDTRGAFSEPISFRTPIDNGELLPKPTAVFPADEAITGSIRVITSFNEIEDSLGYLVYFYDSLEKAEQDEWFKSISAGEKPVAVSVFDPEKTVYWRVKARNDFGWGDLSDARSFTTPAATATGAISPAAGGTFAPDPGFLTIDFPPNSVPADTELTFELFATPQVTVPGNYLFGNRSFAVTASANGQPVTQFSEPFTMTINYSASELAFADIFDPAKLNVIYWDGAEWVEILPCDGCRVDTENQTVVLVLDHLTEFALVSSFEATHVLYLPTVIR